MTKQEIYDNIIELMEDSGYTFVTYAEMQKEHPELSFLDHNASHAYTLVSDKFVFYNERQPLDERIFTMLHEAAHVVCRTKDEDTADNVARFCCALITALTGKPIHAEPITGIPSGIMTAYGNGGEQLF